MTSDSTMPSAFDGPAPAAVSAPSQLDRITAMTALALRVPISTVTVLDGTHARFLGATGIDLDLKPTVSELFSAVTQNLGEAVVVEDARRDPGFRDLDIVVEGGIVFFAGFPLLNRHGTMVGTLCIFDHHPRRLEQHDLDLMREFSSWAEQEMVASTEMRLAAQAQAYLLPAGPLARGPWRLDGLCIPASAVGGDFFDYGTAEDVAYLRLGDVMGKGTPAALIGAGVRAAMRGTNAAVAAGVDLGVTVTQTAGSLFADLERASSFVTLFEAAVDLNDGSLRYVDAGCGMALLLTRDHQIRHLSAQDPPLGVLNDDHWSENRDQLRPGDTLVVFSDGVLDLVGDGPGWQRRMADLVWAHPDPNRLFAEITRMTSRMTALDDVTVAMITSSEGSS